MCTGIALIQSEVPAELIEEFDLEPRLHNRGGESEIGFLWRDPQPLLPIWHEGQFRLVHWGSRDRKSRLPPTAWTWQATVEAGG